MSAYLCEHAWLGGPTSQDRRPRRGRRRAHRRRHAGVRRRGAARQPSAARAHAPRAGQRALARLPPRAARRARSVAGGGGSFWTWREQMYGVADRLDPDSYLALARAVYAEMALAGITAVGEFHYLHHGPGGRPYDDPNAMGHALVAAARDGGRPAHAAGHLLPDRRGRRAAERGPAPLRRRRPRRRGPSASPRCGRPTPTTRRRGRRRRALGARRPGRRRSRWSAPGRASTRRAAARARVRAARRERGRAWRRTAARPPQLLADYGVARAAHAPRCTPPTSPTTTSTLLGEHGRPASACAPRPSATSPTASDPHRAAGGAGTAVAWARTATRSSTCSRRPARSSSTSGWSPCGAGTWTRPPARRRHRARVSGAGLAGRRADPARARRPTWSRCGLDSVAHRRHRHRPPRPPCSRHRRPTSPRGRRRAAGRVRTACTCTCRTSARRSPTAIAAVLR